MVPKILTFGAGQNGKKTVFGSDYLTYGAPFYKWCRFTYGAVTDVIANTGIQIKQHTNTTTYKK